MLPFPDDRTGRREEPKLGERKSRTSIILPVGEGFDMSLPAIPANWNNLPPDCPEVLALFKEESLVVPSGFKRNMPPAYIEKPFSLNWFYAAERLRYGGPGRWFPRLLQFGKHTGETLLGIGDGLGTDWSQFAKGKAKVLVCCPEYDRLQLIKRNFRLRDLDVKGLHSSYAALPLPDSSIDVVHITGLLHDVENPSDVISEVYRVLRPGGKVVAVLPSRPRRWQNWTNPRLFRDGLGSKDLKRLFQPDFIEHRKHRRHLRRRDIWAGYRWLPLPWLERMLGRFWIIKAFKPIRSSQSLLEAPTVRKIA